MAELSVKIGANIKDFQAKLADALKGFDKLKKEEKSLASAFKSGKISADKYYDALAKNSVKLKSASASINKYKSGISSVGQGMSKMSKGVASGNSAMTAFSRTVQDAPFGIMGVSNNITNLTEQFGYLKNKTGSAGGALKAMLKDLKGFGGITLAISLVTSALLVFGDELFKTKDKAKELKEEQEKLTKALKDYEDQLDEVNKSRLIGGRAAASELTSLSLLRDQTLNTTRALDHRKKALKELQKLYPSYFKHLSTDIKDQRELGFAFEKLESKIKDHNKAKAAQGLMSKNQRALTILEIRREEELAKLKKIDPKDSSARTLASEAFEKTLKEVNKLLEENVRLSKIVRNAGGVVPLDFSVEEKEKVKEIFVGFKEVYKKEKEDFQELIETDPIVLADIAEGQTVDWAAYFNQKKLEEEAILLKERLARFSEDLNNMMDMSKLSSLSNFGSAIGNAIGRGQNVIQAAGASLLGSLGDIMVKYGKLILAFGIASEALEEAMKNPFGGGIAAIGAGIALIAIGSAIKGAASSASSGGGGGGGGRASSNTSTFSPSGGGSFSGSGGGGMQNVVFEIQGTKLVGVLSNTLARNRNLGGSLSLT